MYVIGNMKGYQNAWRLCICVICSYDMIYLCDKFKHNGTCLIGACDWNNNASP